MTSRNTAAIIFGTITILFSSIFIQNPEYLLPHGPAVVRKVPLFKPIDYENDSLCSDGKFHKIYERKTNSEPPLLQSFETIIIHPTTKSMYIINGDGMLIQLLENLQDQQKQQTIRTEIVLHDLGGSGQVLGAQFHPHDGSLYMANSNLGLMRVRRDGDKWMKPEVICSRVMGEDGVWSEVVFVDGVTIGSKTGHVYFTSASDIPTSIKPTTKNKKHNLHNYDVVHPSVLDGVRGKPSGTLLRYDPQTDQVDILIPPGSLYFANGVSATPDEKFVFICESFGPDVIRYELSSGNTRRLFSSGAMLPGMPDGLHCVEESSCFVTLATGRPKSVEMMYSLPDQLGVWVRSLVLMLPSGFSPKPTKYGCVVEIDGSGDDDGGGVVKRVIQDPYGEVMTLITDVTGSDDKLYLASVLNDFIGVYDLS